METDQLTTERALQGVKAKEEKNEALVCSLNTINCVEDQATKNSTQTTKNLQLT